MAAVCGHGPSGSTCTNGSSAYARGQHRPRVGAAAPARAVTVARMPRGIGASTGVNDSAGRAGGLLDLRYVLVGADLVGRQVAHHLAAEQVRLGRPAGAGGAGGGDHDHVGRVGRAGGDQRGQRQGDGGRVAAGVGDPGRRRRSAARWPGSSGRP